MKKWELNGKKTEENIVGNGGGEESVFPGGAKMQQEAPAAAISRRRQLFYPAKSFRQLPSPTRHERSLGDTIGHH